MLKPCLLIFGAFVATALVLAPVASAFESFCSTYFMSHDETPVAYACTALIAALLAGAAINWLAVCALYARVAAAQESPVWLTGRIAAAPHDPPQIRVRRGTPETRAERLTEGVRAMYGSDPPAPVRRLIAELPADRALANFDTGDECIVCLESADLLMLLPCAHRACCAPCFRRMRDVILGSRCPLCRTPPTISLLESE